ncbi:MAG: hypothetical protein HY543_10595 [Deltaproteobacteria bacterium]|nr:hypothetical protein [Deltaproteobacteria bacterium]
MLKWIPPARWDEPWPTREGGSLTVRTVMETARAAYRAWDGAALPDHSLLHLPQLLLAYCKGIGRDPAEAKALFFAKALRPLLAMPIARKEFLAFAAHAIESLGTFAADPVVTWSTAEQAVVRAVIDHLRDFLLQPSPTPLNAELSHLLTGLRLLTQHYTRIGL